MHDHRADLVAERTRIQNRLRWHLHDLDPELQIPTGALNRRVWLDRLGRRLARLEQTAQVRIGRELVGRCRELSRRVDELERELASLLREQAPARCSSFLVAARSPPRSCSARSAGVGRFASDAKLAKHTGSAPLPASSGQRQRHRLNRSGNRQLNCALHRIAITQARMHPPARAYLERKQAEGKSRREALRCLKRHLARTIYRTLRAIEETKMTPTTGPVAAPALT